MNSITTKLLNNETKDICATQLYIHIGGRSVSLPQFESNQSEKLVVDFPADEINGIYHCYDYRQEDHQLNFKSGGKKLFKDGDNPVDGEYHSYFYVGSYEVKSFDHDGIRITGGTVEVFEPFKVI